MATITTVTHPHRQTRVTPLRLFGDAKSSAMAPTRCSVAKLAQMAGLVVGPSQACRLARWWSLLSHTTCLYPQSRRWIHSTAAQVGRRCGVRILNARSPARRDLFAATRGVGCKSTTNSPGGNCHRAPRMTCLTRCHSPSSIPPWPSSNFAHRGALCRCLGSLSCSGSRPGAAGYHERLDDVVEHHEEHGSGRGTFSEIAMIVRSLHCPRYGCY